MEITYELLIASVSEIVNNEAMAATDASSKDGHMAGVWKI